MANIGQEFFFMMVLFLALLAMCFGQPPLKRSAEIGTEAFQSLLKLILALFQR